MVGTIYALKCLHHEMYRIDINFVIKVADFGLSESIGTKDYFRQDKDSTIKLPLKWLAPESMEDHIFSEKSDVVSIILLLYANIAFKLSYHIHGTLISVGLWRDLLGDI